MVLGIPVRTCSNRDETWLGPPFLNYSVDSKALGARIAAEDFQVKQTC